VTLSEVIVDFPQPVGMTGFDDVRLTQHERVLAVLERDEKSAKDAGIEGAKACSSAVVFQFRIV
jgi:hypothetical protein